MNEEIYDERWRELFVTLKENNFGRSDYIEIIASMIRFAEKNCNDDVVQYFKKLAEVEQ